MSEFERARGLRLERIRSCPRFDGSGFRNTHPATPGIKLGSALPTLGEFLFGNARRTPRRPLPVVSPLGRWASTAETGLRATWLGHSTVLVGIDGARLLTDPVWGERVSPLSFAGPTRFHPAPVAVSDLPELDAVLVSHDH